MLIEVLIRSHLEQMKIICDLSQSAATAELFLQLGDLVGFLWIGKRLHLSLLVNILLSLALDFLLVPIISLFLILVTLHDSILSFSTRIIRFQRCHQFICAGDGFVEATPGLLWFVHEWVFFRYLHPLDDILTTDDVLISWCQLEHLV